MAGTGGYRPGAGRKPGSKGKATIERELVAKLKRGGRPPGRLNDKTIAALGGPEARAEIAAKQMTGAITSRRKMAVTLLEEFMFVFAGMAAHYQPAPPGALERPGADEGKFEKWATHAITAAKELAKYQSPQYMRVHMPAPPPDPNSQKRRFTLTVFEGGKPVPPMLALRDGELVDDEEDGR